MDAKQFELMMTLAARVARMRPEVPLLRVPGNAAKLVRMAASLKKLYAQELDYRGEVPEAVGCKIADFETKAAHYATELGIGLECDGTKLIALFGADKLPLE